jgi:hypothetical protein
MTCLSYFYAHLNHLPLVLVASLEPDVVEEYPDLLVCGLEDDLLI